MNELSNMWTNSNFQNIWTLSMAWLANKMKWNDLLSEDGYEDVVKLKSVFIDSQKALIMYHSLKIYLRYLHLEKKLF